MIIRSFKWLTKAAEQGVPRSYFHLAVMYYQGEGTKKDFSEAIHYFYQVGSIR